MKYKELITILDKKNSVVFGDYTVTKDECNTIFCTHKNNKNKNFIVSDECSEHKLEILTYNLADDFINYSAVSELLTGTKRAINSNRVPDKHSIAINELRSLVKKWIDKNKKEGEAAQKKWYVHYDGVLSYGEFAYGVDSVYDDDAIFDTEAEMLDYIKINYPEWT